MFCFRLPQIYDEFYHTVNNADHEKGRENEKRTTHCPYRNEEGYQQYGSAFLGTVPIPSVSDPDPDWIRIQPGRWIRIQSGQWTLIRIRIQEGKNNSQK